MNPEESIEEAAKRETEEESGIKVYNLERVGKHEFEFLDNPGVILEVHVFCSTTYSGEITETEEMKPCWFRYEDIPYTTMWPDDIYWLPLLLEGKKFQTKFLFGENDTVLEWSVEERGDYLE